MRTHFKKTILIDLDGVLNIYNGKFDENTIPAPRQDSKEFLNELSQDFEIKIFTTRNRLKASQWLIENDLDKYVTDVTNVKEPCFLHIDDRCITFRGNTKETIKQVKQFTPHWKE